MTALLLLGKAYGQTSSPYSPENLKTRIQEAGQIQAHGKNPSLALQLLLELLREEDQFLTDSLNRFRMYNGIANAFKFLHLSREREIYLKKALAMNPGSAWGRAEPRTEYYALSDMAGFYLFEEQMDSALVYYRKAKACIFRVEGTKKYSQELASLNNLGILHARMGSLDSALAYFSLALEGFIDSVCTDTGLWMAINDNLAENNLARGELETAMEFYDQNLSLAAESYPSNPPRNLRRQVKSALGKVNILDTLGRQREAISLLSALEQELQNSPLPVPLALQKSIHKQFQHLYTATEQLKLALYHSDKANEIREAISAKRQDEHDEALRGLANFNVQDLEERLSLEQKENEIELELARAQSRARLQLIVFASSILLLAMVVIILRNRRRQRQRAEQLQMKQALIRAELRQQELEKEKLALEVQNEQNEKSRIQWELESRQKDVEALALDINRKKEWAKRLLGFIRSLRNMKEVERLLSLTDLESEVRNQLRSGERQQKFQERIDLVNHEFYLTLEQRFPALTNAEKELCGFIRMKLSNSEIASLRNISDASVRTARYRLRKKMELSREQDLDIFIENLKVDWTQGGDRG